MAGLRILLVEDDEVDVMSARRALERIGDAHELEVLRDGSAALGALNEPAAPGRLPDLLLLDLNLPGASGFEILAALRKRPEASGPPAVVLTTSADASDVARAFELGAAGYFVKPAGFEAYAALLDTICAYWSRSTSPLAPR